nr:hypothetical protein [Tanacetum cinerariifolium]
MSPGNICHRGTTFLTGKYVGPTVSLGIVAGEGIPCERSQRTFPGDKSLGKSIPSDKSPGKTRMNLVELSPKKRVTYWGLFRGQNDVTEESKIVKPTIEDDDDDSTNNGPSENETERIKDTDTLLSKLANVDPKFAAFNEVVVLILACASVRYHLIQS